MEVIIAYLCFEGPELHLGELALQRWIRDKNTNEGRHCLPISVIRLVILTILFLALAQLLFSSQNSFPQL